MLPTHWPSGFDRALPVLLDSGAKGAVVLALAALLAALLRRRSAAVRHAVWTVALGAQVALPLLAIVLPAWRVGMPEWAAGVGRGVSGVVPSVALRPAPSGRESSANPSRQAERAPAPISASTERRVHSASGATPQVTPPAARLPLPATIYLLGTALVLLRLVAGTVAVSRLARRGARVHDGGWLSLAGRLADTLGIRRPLILLRGDRLAVPVTWGIVYPVVLLPEEADAWPDERRRYVLVHEMAHVQRLDALTQLVAQLAVALFWFDPLVWYAARRMRVEREQACDDVVLRHGTAPSAYASDLLDMVRDLASPQRRAAQPAFAALAMARRSEFEGRMLSILDPRQDRHPLRGRAIAAGAVLALGLVLPLAMATPAEGGGRREAGGVKHAAADARAPGVVAATAGEATNAQSLPASRPAPPAPGDLPAEARCKVAGETYSVHTGADDAGREGTSILLADAARCVRAGIRGQLVVADDDRDLRVRAPGALRLAERRAGGPLRELVIDVRGGAESRRYFVDGRERSVAESREWLGTVLPYLLRQSGLDVPARVARLHRRGGTTAVLDEIGRLPSDGVQRRYYAALAALPGLAAGDRDRLVRHASRELAGDGDLRGLLDELSRGRERLTLDAQALAEAVRHLQSEGDLTAVLGKLATHGDRATLLMVAREAERITGDGDRSMLLGGAAARYLAGDDAALHRAWFRLAAGITSDGDLSTLLRAASAYARPDCAVTDGIIAATHRISSDGDRADVLVALARRGVLRDAATRRRFLEAAKGITSDGDYRRVLDALL